MKGEQIIRLPYCLPPHHCCSSIPKLWHDFNENEFVNYGNYVGKNEKFQTANNNNIITVHLLWRRRGKRCSMADGTKHQARLTLTRVLQKSTLMVVLRGWRSWVGDNKKKNHTSPYACGWVFVLAGYRCVCALALSGATLTAIRLRFFGFPWLKYLCLPTPLFVIHAECLSGGAVVGEWHLNEKRFTKIKMNIS